MISFWRFQGILSNRVWIILATLLATSSSSSSSTRWSRIKPIILRLTIPDRVWFATFPSIIEALITNQMGFWTTIKTLDFSIGKRLAYQALEFFDEVQKKFLFQFSLNERFVHCVLRHFKGLKETKKDLKYCRKKLKRF